MMTSFNGIMTGVLLVLFIAIWVWAWSGKNREKFDRMAHMPLEDNEEQSEIKSGIKSEVNNVK